MRVIIISSLLLIMVSTALGALNYPLLQVSSTMTSMKPGETGYVTISLRNDGSLPAYETKVALSKVTAPLSSLKLCTNCLVYSNTREFCLEYADECFFKVGDVYGSDVKDITFPIAIPKDAPTGYYLAEFLIKYVSYNNTAGTEQTKYINHHKVIWVDNELIKPELSVINAYSTPSVVTPGEIFNYSLKVFNNGDYDAGKVLVTINSSVFSSYGASNVINLGDISSSGSKDATLQLVSDKSLIPGLYQVTLTLNYDKDGDASYSSTSKAGVIVGGNTTFEIYIQDVDPDLILNGEEVTVTLSIANTGILIARAVNVKLNRNDDVTIGNVNEDFIGDLDPGDYTSASFRFKPVTNGEVKLDFEMSYTNQLGERINTNITQTIYIGYGITDKPTTTSLLPFGGFFIQNAGVFILLIVVIIIIYFFLKSKRKGN